MTDENNTSKKAKYDLGIGLGIFIISTLIGYFFNSYMSKDDINIENVEIIPEYHRFNFNRKLFSEIETLKETSFMFGGRIMQEYPDELNENYKAILLSQLKRDLSKANAKLTQLNKLKQNIETGDILIESQSLINFYPTYQNQKPTKEKLLKQVDYKIASITRLQEKEKALLNEIRQFRKSRNGKCKISITFLNSGNTDGLVKPEAKLIIKPYDEPIAIKVLDSEENNQLSPYFPVSQSSPKVSTAIPKRSMVNLKFQIVEDEVGKKRILEDLQQMLIKKQNFRCKVRITDFRNDEYESNFYLQL
ncbi:hypothetical protein [Flammeovirga sp. SubArs3]|uniref:hypothetical protein n=1 Tax=Flammeovirga sp. SubArs3 TaxID=2995316 RepID=UPI00248BE942|nr:hypothetical protein [Flammeovirga sp. SubArs3]